MKYFVYLINGSIICVKFELNNKSLHTKINCEERVSGTILKDLFLYVIYLFTLYK